MRNLSARKKVERSNKSAKAVLYVKAAQFELRLARFAFSDSA
jgi:hypothetical protein